MSSTLSAHFAASGGVGVVSGVLYMTTATALEAFDATGHANCSGTPTTCSPLWRARPFSAQRTDRLERDRLLHRVGHARRL